MIDRDQVSIRQRPGRLQRIRDPCTLVQRDQTRVFHLTNNRDHHGACDLGGRGDLFPRNALIIHGAGSGHRPSADGEQHCTGGGRSLFHRDAHPRLWVAHRQEVFFPGGPGELLESFSGVHTKNAINPRHTRQGVRKNLWITRHLRATKTTVIHNYEMRTPPTGRLPLRRYASRSPSPAARP